MKRIKYIAAAILTGTILVSSPVLATPGPAEKSSSDSSSSQVVQPGKADDESLLSGQKVEASRKEIVARVEGVEISMFDLVGMMNRVANAFYSHIKEPNAEVTAEIKRRALDRLIFEELAIKEAIKQGINPKPGEVDKVIRELKSAYGSAAEFQAYLDGLAVTEEGMRERIIRSRRLEGITGREVYQKVINDEDVFKEAYNDYKEAGKLKKSDDFLIKEILLMEGASKEATRERADKLLVELKGYNNDFGKLVLDGSFVVRRKPINKNKYPVIFAEMQEMTPGQLSGVVEDDGTFHIFEVLSNELARDMTEDEARGFIEDRLAPYFQDMRRAEWQKELLQGADIEILLDGFQADK